MTGLAVVAVAVAMAANTLVRESVSPTVTFAPLTENVPADTALAMGMKPKTVRSHLTRGRAQLAEWLRDEAALTDAERRALNRALAADQGLDVMPAPRGQRGRPQDADGHMDGTSDVEGGDDDE